MRDNYSQLLRICKMHSQVTDSKSDPEETISCLQSALPDIVKDLDFEEGPYVILSELAIALRDGITDEQFSEDELNAIFIFLNRLGASENTEVQNQLVVGVLEILTDSPETVDVCKQRLIGPALPLFERTQSGWAT